MKDGLTSLCFALFVAGSLGLTVGCLPHHLEKYKNQDSKGNPLTEKNLAGPMDDPLIPLSPLSRLTPKEPKERQAHSSAPPHIFQAKVPEVPKSQGSTIYQVDPNTFHFKLAEAEVWDTVLDVLMRNYSLAIVDRNSGVLATDWDSFYLGKSVFRNKLSFRVKKTTLSRNEAAFGVDLTVHNSVEKLSDSSQGAFSLGAVWLPAKDPIEEVHRVIQNMAMLLRQPPPTKMVEPDSTK